MNSPSQPSHVNLKDSNTARPTPVPSHEVTDNSRSQSASSIYCSYCNAVLLVLIPAFVEERRARGSRMLQKFISPPRRSLFNRTGGDIHARPAPDHERPGRYNRGWHSVGVGCARMCVPGVVCACRSCVAHLPCVRAVFARSACRTSPSVSVV